MKHPSYSCHGAPGDGVGCSFVSDDYPLAARHADTTEHLMFDLCCNDGTCEHVQPDGASSGCWHEPNRYRGTCSVCGIGFLTPAAAWAHFEGSGNSPRHDIDVVAA
jgi:hypothetical protein